MKVLFRFFLLCGMIQCIASSCTGSEADRVHYCKTFQKDYSEGIKTLIFEEQDVGVINSTVFSSPNLRSVMTLTLRGSRIHTIESGAFRHFSGLITLELQNNKLTTVSPSWFGDPTILEHLNVAGNVIDQLRPDMLDGFSGLKVLNLSRNEIQKIGSESFAALSSLSSLDLSHNKLASLHPAALAPLSSTYRLQGNPWDCSCAQRDLIMFLQGLVNASRLNESTLVTCRSPPDLDGAIVWNVSKVNCSASVILPSSGAGIHHVIFPVLFVVLGGLFFSLSMWMILCFLASRCKNKVTNITNSKCDLQSSEEKGEGYAGSQHDPYSMFSNRIEDGATDPMQGLEDSKIFTPHSDPLSCHENTMEKQLEKCVYYGHRSSNSNKESFAKSVSAPMLLPHAGEMPKDWITRTEKPIHLTTAQVHPHMTELLNMDSTHPSDARLGIDGTKLPSLNQESSLPPRTPGMGSDAEYGEKTDEGYKCETGLVTYFETHIELMGSLKNEANSREGQVQSKYPSQENVVQPEKSETSTTLGKKSKTWSTFYDPELDCSKHQPETQQDFDNSVCGDNKTMVASQCDLGKREHENCSHKSKEDENINIKQSKEMLSIGKDIWKYSTDFISEGPKVQGKNTSQKAKPMHVQEARERLWKYHRNCCDEYQPCPTAAKALKQLKTLEKQLEVKANESPPSDEDLLEEKPSQSANWTEGQMLCNPTFTSCVSLPDLRQPRSHQAFPSAYANNDFVNATLSGLPVIGKGEALIRNNVTHNVLSTALAKDLEKSAGNEQKNPDNDLSLPKINDETTPLRAKHVSVKLVELPSIYGLQGVSVKQTMKYVMPSHFDLPGTGCYSRDFNPENIDLQEVKDHFREVRKTEAGNKENVTPIGPCIAKQPSGGVQQGLQFNSGLKQVVVDGASIQKGNVPCSPNLPQNVSMSLAETIPRHKEYSTLNTSTCKSHNSQESSDYAELSKSAFYTQSHLSTAASCTNSSHDGDEEWPKMAHMLKHLSTVSLSSKFDILNKHLDSFKVLKSDSNLIMDNQACLPGDHVNMVEEEALSFQCGALEQLGSEGRHGFNGLETNQIYCIQNSGECPKTTDQKLLDLQKLDNKAMDLLKNCILSQRDVVDLPCNKHNREIIVVSRSAPSFSKTSFKDHMGDIAWVKEQEANHKGDHLTMTKDQIERVNTEDMDTVYGHLDQLESKNTFKKVTENVDEISDRGEKLNTSETRSGNKSIVEDETGKLQFENENSFKEQTKNMADADDKAEIHKADTRKKPEVQSCNKKLLGDQIWTTGNVCDQEMKHEDHCMNILESRNLLKDQMKAMVYANEQEMIDNSRHLEVPKVQSETKNPFQAQRKDIGYQDLKPEDRHLNILESENLFNNQEEGMLNVNEQETIDKELNISEEQSCNKNLMWDQTRNIGYVCDQQRKHEDYRLNKSESGNLFEDQRECMFNVDEQEIIYNRDLQVPNMESLTNTPFQCQRKDIGDKESKFEDHLNISESENQNESMLNADAQEIIRNSDCLEVPKVESVTENPFLDQRKDIDDQEFKPEHHHLNRFKVQIESENQFIAQTEGMLYVCAQEVNHEDHHRNKLDVQMESENQFKDQTGDILDDLKTDIEYKLDQEVNLEGQHLNMLKVQSESQSLSKDPMENMIFVKGQSVNEKVGKHQTEGSNGSIYSKTKISDVVRSENKINVTNEKNNDKVRTFATGEELPCFEERSSSSSLSNHMTCDLNPIKSETEIDDSSNLSAVKDRRDPKSINIVQAESFLEYLEMPDSNKKDNLNGSQCCFREKDDEETDFHMLENRLLKKTIEGNMTNTIPDCNLSIDNDEGHIATEGITSSSEISGNLNQQISDDLKKNQKILTGQKCKRNRTLKPSNKVFSENTEAKEESNKSLLTKLYRRPFHSFFSFTIKTPASDSGDAPENKSIEGEPMDSGPSSSSPLHSMKSCTEQPSESHDQKMDAIEYLTHLYAMPFQDSHITCDGDDISVLANLHFCKFSLPGELKNLEISEKQNDLNEDSTTTLVKPEPLYSPPSKEELKADDKLAVLHIMYTLKRSLELSKCNTESDAD